MLKPPYFLCPFFGWGFCFIIVSIGYFHPYLLVCLVHRLGPPLSPHPHLCNQFNHLSPVSHFLLSNQSKLCFPLVPLMISFQVLFHLSTFLLFLILIICTILNSEWKKNNFLSCSLVSTARFAPCCFWRDSKGRCDKLPPLIILMCWLFFQPFFAFLLLIWF